MGDSSARHFLWPMSRAIDGGAIAARPSSAEPGEGRSRPGKHCRRMRQGRPRDDPMPPRSDADSFPRTPPRPPARAGVPPGASVPTETPSHDPYHDESEETAGPLGASRPGGYPAGTAGVLPLPGRRCPRHARPVGAARAGRGRALDGERSRHQGARVRGWATRPSRRPSQPSTRCYMVVRHSARDEALRSASPSATRARLAPRENKLRSCDVRLQDISQTGMSVTSQVVHEPDRPVLGPPRRAHATDLGLEVYLRGFAPRGAWHPHPACVPRAPALRLLQGRRLREEEARGVIRRLGSSRLPRGADLATTTRSTPSARRKKLREQLWAIQAARHFPWPMSRAIDGGAIAARPSSAEPG